MKLIILLLILGLEKFVHIGNFIFRFNWFNAYLGLMRKACGKTACWRGILGAIGVLLPLLIVVALVYYLLCGWLYGIIDFIIAALILIYCLGPRDLYSDVEKYFVAQTQSNQDAINKSLDVLTREKPKEETQIPRAVTKGILHEFNTRLFSVLFWFVVLGPVGAVLYRVAEQTKVHASAKNSQDKALLSGARFIQDILDWIPIRLAALGYALVGDFHQGFKYWMKNLTGGLEKNAEFMEQSGLNALKLTGKSAAKSNVDENKSALMLVDHTLFLYLVVVAVFTLGAWIY